MWNAVTSPETLLNGYSVKTLSYNTLSPYFIVLASPVEKMEVKAIEVHLGTRAPVETVLLILSMPRTGWTWLNLSTILTNAIDLIFYTFSQCLLNTRCRH